MGVEYVEGDRVMDVRVTDVPASGRTVTGYGGAVPTKHMILYLGAWRRVYAMAYGNSASLYVRVKGRDVFVGGAVEERLRPA